MLNTTVSLQTLTKNMLNVISLCNFTVCVYNLFFGPAFTDTATSHLKPKSCLYAADGCRMGLEGRSFTTQQTMMTHCRNVKNLVLHTLPIVVIDLTIDNHTIK